MKLNKIPLQLSDYWESVKDEFAYKYYHVFCWVVIAHCVNPGKCTLRSLCRFIPERILYKRLVRLLQSDKWNFIRIFQWHCRQVWKALPPPEDGILYLITDATLCEKTGEKHPYSGKTKTGNDNKYHFGFYVVIVMVHWGPYRFPIDFCLVSPKTDPEHKTQNELFREMFQDFVPPRWTKKVIVLGDSAFASKENLKAIMRRNENSPCVQYFFTFSIARTWKIAGEKTVGGKQKQLKDLVNHLPHYRFKKMWFPLNNGRRRYYWVYTRQIRRDTLGTVTIVISKSRRNTPPKKSKIFVTNIPDSKPRDVVMTYRHRWFAEVLNHELKSACGLGDHQVTKEKERVQRSVALSMICYLTILRFEADKIHSGFPWSINTLKHFFTIRIFQSQSEPAKPLQRNKKAA